MFWALPGGAQGVAFVSDQGTVFHRLNSGLLQVKHQTFEQCTLVPGSDIWCVRERPNNVSPDF